VTNHRLTIIAGANGSGKTTFTSDIKFFREIPLLDPDAIGKTLESTMPLGFPLASARQVLTAAGEHPQAPHLENREMRGTPSVWSDATDSS
jgi:predicted ABC-type ATPase